MPWVSLLFFVVDRNHWIMLDLPSRISRSQPAGLKLVPPCHGGAWPLTTERFGKAEERET